SPPWIARPENLATKMHSTVILTVLTQEEVDYDMLVAYSCLADMPPSLGSRSRNQSATLDHYTFQCRKEPTCHVCAGPHLQNKH
ncbi:hypothetical protein J3A83DRAFT_4044247, partial [Scleroderma citrinum]